jgi:hypothetical protein
MGDSTAGLLARGSMLDHSPSQALGPVADIE